jgi:hypothetical protein
MNFSIEHIIKLETCIWEALRTGDAQLDATMLADDFLGVYPTGFACKEQHCEQLKDGATVARFEIQTPRLTVLGEERALLSYLAIWSRIQNGQEQPAEQMYVSSIWQRINGTWLNTFSQDTPAVK